MNEVLVIVTVAPEGLGAAQAADHVELPVAETISKTHWARDQLGAQHAGVKRVRALPIGDMDDAVV
jgi:hypothetical protein